MRVRHGVTPSTAQYIPESEAQWPSIMTLLGSYIYKSVHGDLHSHEIYPEIYTSQEPLDPTQNQRVWEMFRWDMVSDAAQFDGGDGAMLGTVHVHFQQRMAQRPTGWDWKCIIVDKEVFELLKGLPIPKDSEEDKRIQWLHGSRQLIRIWTVLEMEIEMTQNTRVG